MEKSAPSGPESPAGSPARFAVAARITIIAIGALSFLYLAREVVLPVVVAWVFGMALKPPMRWLGALGVPAPVAALLVLVAMGIPTGWGFARFARPAMEWLEEAPANVGRLKDRLGYVMRPAQRLSEAAANMGKISESAPAAPTVEVANHEVASTVFTWTRSALVGLAETVALLFLLLAAGDQFLHKVVRVMPTFADKRRAVDITREVQQAISSYLFSVGLINFSFGGLLAAALALAGMPEALMWGLAAALLNFIPYFGPVLGVGLMGMAGLLAFETWGAGLLPAALYLAMHLLEANVITPYLIGRRMTLNPVVVFTSLMFFVWLWGVPGALVAVPLLVTARVVCERMPSLASMAEFLSR